MTDWAPIVTLVLGYGVKSVEDWVQNHRKVQAEREARTQARREKRADQRDDLQRQTLLELQQCVLDLARATAKGQISDREAYRSGDGQPWGTQAWPGDLAEQNRLANMRVALLRSRIRDESLRETVRRFSEACTAQTLARNEAQADQAQKRAAEAVTQVLEQAGQIVREMDTL